MEERFRVAATYGIDCAPTKHATLDAALDSALAMARTAGTANAEVVIERWLRYGAQWDVIIRLHAKDGKVFNLATYVD